LEYDIDLGKYPITGNDSNCWYVAASNDVVTIIIRNWVYNIIAMKHIT